jgi:hypothetical protein
LLLGFSFGRSVYGCSPYRDKKLSIVFCAFFDAASSAMLLINIGGNGARQPAQRQIAQDAQATESSVLMQIRPGQGLHYLLYAVIPRGTYA